MEDISKKYADVASFVYVYIKEAHPDDEWQVEKNRIGNVVFNQPRTMEERLLLATTFQESMGTKTTILVDDMRNTANAVFAAWPERIYMVDTNGKIIYKGKMGPFYFDPNEIVPILEKRAASGPADRPSGG
jgi:hypothetical protein